MNEDLEQEVVEDEKEEGADRRRKERTYTWSAWPSFARLQSGSSAAEDRSSSSSTDSVLGGVVAPERESGEEQGGLKEAEEQALESDEAPSRGWWGRSWFSHPRNWFGSGPAGRKPPGRDSWSCNGP